MNKIKSGFFAVAEVDDPEGHAEYNWFHSSDHIPENLALDGVILAARWAAPQRYMDARLAVHPSFATSQYLIHYLMTEPLEEAFQQFAELSGRTRSLGRYFEPRTIHASGHYNLLKAYVAPRLPISPEAVPFRPHRGVFVVMKDLLDLSKRQELAQWHDQVHVPDVLTVKGVTGCYWFESWTRERAPSSGPGHPEQRWVFLYYLDEDPLEMMADLPKKQAEWRAPVEHTTRANRWRWSWPGHTRPSTTQSAMIGERNDPQGVFRREQQSLYLELGIGGDKVAQPKSVDVQPDSIRIEWDDGHVSTFSPRYLRGECRCAGCVNELTGRREVGYDNVAEDVQALDWMTVGRYALQFLWSDAHDTGIYPYAALRDELCPCDQCVGERA